MNKEALLLIDIQNIYFTPGPMLLHKPREAAKKTATLLKKFRAEGKHVIHIKHNFKAFSGIHNLYMRFSWHHWMIRLQRL